ncbi:MAG: LuxR C-terminal-related transcriptional regulator [Pseudomonadota bacterium]
MQRSKSRVSPFPVELLDLLGNLYEAALLPDQWSDVVCNIRHLLNADSGQLFTPPGGSTQRFLYAADNLSDEALRQYGDYYWQLDVWRNRAMERGDTYQGLIQRGDDVIDLKSFQRTEIFNDHLKPAGIERLLTNILFDERSDRIAPRTHLSLFRRPGQQAFSEQEIDLMRLLMPHLQRALTLYWRFREADLLRSANEELLAKLGHGLIFLAHNGEVAYLNPVAKRILDRKDGLGLQAGRINASNRQQDKLDSLLGDANNGIGGHLCIRRPPGQKPYHLQAIPLSERHCLPGMSGIPLVTLLLQDPESSIPKESFAALAKAYELTAAETRVFEGLVAGLSTRGIATSNHISMHTVRSHLAALFAKTGTTQQRDLVLLAFLAGGMGTPPGPMDPDRPKSVHS